jgi:hypothetical protein
MPDPSGGLRVRLSMVFHSLYDLERFAVID